jgi:TolB-like protein/Flp pilus assembly protein TadD
MSGLSRLLGAFRRRRGVRLAVLPFQPTVRRGERREGPDPRKQVYGSGLAEELIALLSRNPTLDVVGPLSVREFVGRTSDPASWAEELGVGLVLTGRVDRTDTDLSVEARLVTAPEGADVWVERWALRPEDLFVILGEAAAKVGAAAGAARTTPPEALIHREPTSDLTAWDLYVEGRALLGRPDPSAIRSAVTAFEAALEHDELFASALAAIAEAYRIAHESHIAIDRQNVLPMIRRIAERALELDDALPGAYVSLAYADVHAWDLGSAERHLGRAIGLAPSHAQAHRWLSRVRLYQRDLPAAIAHAERALELEPLSTTVINESGVPYALAGRPEVAIERARRVVHRDPEHAMAYFHLGKYAEQTGRYGEAVTYYRAASELSGRVPFLTAFLGMVLVKLGDRHEAEDIANDLERKGRRGSPVAACLGVLLLRLGRVDDGLTWIESALEAREMQLLLIDTLWLPLPEGVRADPRIVALLDRMPVSRHR